MGSKSKALIILSASLLALSILLTFLPGWAVIFDVFGLKDLDRRDRIVFLDVGQGDSALILSDGHAALLDCGTGADDGNSLLAALRQAGVDAIDCLILSHPHYDHIGGASAVMRQFPVGQIRMPAGKPTESADVSAYEYLMQSAAKSGVPVEPLQTADRFTVGHFTFEVLLCDTKAEDENDRSAIIRASNEKNTLLFTGDAGRDTEYKLIEMGRDLSCDLLKVGHHGSDTATSEKFLYVTHPDVAVISVGDNAFGHPNRDVLDRLAAQNIAVYRTDVSGSVTVYLDETMTFTTQR